MEKEIATIQPKSRQEWRQWLEANHDTQKSVWLIYHKKKANLPTVTYSDTVDEALCFGWIDSKAKPLDEERFMQFFCPRKAKSVWSKINKQKIDRLTKEGRMTKAGFDTIERAKLNGSWTILDEVEELVVPDDLAQALAQQPEAENYFGTLSRSDKRNLLQWLVLAKRPETRQKRINEIVTLANLRQKPKQFTAPKKST